jgi:tRNA dimethylallyltransferase
VGQKKSSALVAVVGPTAVGKTEVSIALCRRVGGEVISADSRQIYRELDIGTDKPSAEQRSLVAHHLLDVVDPDEEFTLAQYQEMAYEAIDGVLARDRVPFLVGGTGLYVRAVLEGFSIPRVKPDVELRQRLLEEAEADGGASLFARLSKVDPEAAERIDARNVRRVVRALEVFETIQQPISELQKRKPPPYRILKLGVTMDREELYRRIDERVDTMIERGLVSEVEGLLRKGYSEELPAMSGLGYRQVAAYLRGKVDLPDAIRMIKSETHRFVRQQYKWFRVDDETIHWFDVGSETVDRIEALLVSFLERTSQGSVVV